MAPKKLPNQYLSSLKKPQIILVAKVAYNYDLNQACTVGQLRDDLSRRMQTVTNCENEGCAGEQCNPAVHVFTPEVYTPVTNRENLEALLETSQRDPPLPSPQTSPANPPADGAAQRRALAEQALAKVGLSLEEVSSLDVLPIDTGATSGHDTDPARTGTRRKTGGVLKNMLNSITGAAQPRSPLVPGPRASTPAPRLGPGAVVNRPLFPQPPQQRQAAAAQDDSSTLADTLKTMMQLMSDRQEAEIQERAEERRLREEALKNQIALAGLLEGNAAGKTDELKKGRVALVPHGNPVALAMTGCSIPPQFAIKGDTESIDLSHAKNKIKSGRAKQVLSDARFAETWPNQYLAPLTAASTGGLSHEQLSLCQWAGGFVAKIFAEIDETRNNSKEHNQLHMLMNMLRLAETYPWADIIALNEALFSALERGTLSWLSWEPLEKWWQMMENSLRTQVASRQAVPSKRPLAAIGAGAAPGGAQQPAAKKKKTDVDGVPGDFLKTNNVCIKWNINACNVQEAPHASPERGSTAQLQHICGACLYLKKTTDGSHSMKSCSLRNKQGVFC